MLFFDDVPQGYRSLVGTYKISKEEIVEFATKWDPQFFHIDEKKAQASIFKGLVASSLHLFAICTRLFFDHKDNIQILSMLGKDQIRLHAPARPDDVISYTTECVEWRPSKSRSDRGVIVLEDTLTNQKAEVLMTQQVSLLVARRPSK